MREQLSGPENHTALRFLNRICWGYPTIVQELIPEIFEWACMQSHYSLLARYILAGLRPRYRDAPLEPLIATELDNLTPDRWDEIRGLVTLLEDLRRDDVLAELKSRLLASSDEELLDIAEDIDGPPSE